MDLVREFKEAVKHKDLFTKKDRLLIAVSGGVDSIVLTALCYQAGYPFIIAHCNFKLRGEESERDEKFVRSLADKYNVQLVIKDFQTDQYASDHVLSIQEAARILRYQWFNDLIKENAIADILLTAHHADDNIETLLMHFFRGTGLHGLTGIPSRNDYIRRPLLGFTKEMLTGFAREQNLSFVEDSSNNSVKYTRNLFRNELLPAITRVYPEVKSNLTDNIERFRGIEKIYKYGVSEISKKLIRQKGTEVHISVRELVKWNNRALIYEIISKYGFSEKQVSELYKLADSDSGKYITSPDKTYRIIRHRHWFIITPVSSDSSEIIIIENGEREVHFGRSSLTVERIHDNISSLSASPSIAHLDAKEIEFPLMVRKWKPADYFYPLGMAKKKKISRFLIDRKASKTDKENTWVIESGKRIIWVVGQRIDDRFKVHANTKVILRLILK